MVVKEPCVATLPGGGGRMAVESAAEWSWNGWPNAHGMGGRMAVESASKSYARTNQAVGLQHRGAKETALVVFCRYILTTTDVIQHHGSMETSHQTILDLAAQRGLIRPRGTVMLTFSGRKKSITLNLKLHFAHTHHATRQSDVPSPRGNEQL